MSTDYGWKTSISETEVPDHNWEVLRENVQNYIKGINFSYKGRMSEIGVDYINAKAQFVDERTIKF